MSEGLISAEVKTSLEKIISHCFYCNRLVDRMCSILSVTFVMPKTSNLIHHNLAHYYPVLADKISDYMDSRDCTVIYDETPRGDQDYDTVLDCFNKMLEINLNFESYIKDAIKLAQDTNDYTTKVYLEKYLEKIIPITKDILTLVGKAEMYGDSNNGMMKFDDNITDFGIFGEE
jgi:ferritin-like domain|nr:MAG TPA: Ferritin-like protein [Caudoviricetes sp.]